MSPTVDSPHSAETAFDRYSELLAMFSEFDRFTPEILPSRYWEALNRKHLHQLADTGYKNSSVAWREIISPGSSIRSTDSSDF